MVSRKKIAVVGIGYVGLSNAIALAKQNEVVAYDIDTEKVSFVNDRKSPLSELEIIEYLAQEELYLQATSSKEFAFLGAEFIFIATPTNYDEINDCFDTSTVVSVIKEILECNKTAIIIVRSTIPIGFIDYIREECSYRNIIFCPEFLREGHSLSDIFYPSRIVVGDTGVVAESVSKLLLSSSKNKDTPVVFTGTKEAEAIKLFSNTYLAMRISFFNELDTYALSMSLDTKQIVEGVSFDPRIGGHYNNPSFGYGGYCLPKDTKQLLANYTGIPNKLIQAIVDSNDTRKETIINSIVKKNIATVGVYRLIMKSGSDNFRSSAMLDIIEGLLARGLNVIIYEPNVDKNLFRQCDFEDNLIIFKDKCDLIVANRISDEVLDVKDKVFTRDIFGTDK